MGRGMTIAQWMAEFERTGKAPFPFAMGGESSPPNPDPKNDRVFTQEQLNAIVQREKSDADARAKDRLKADVDFMAEITAKVKADLEGATTAEKKQKEGEFKSLLDDVLALKQGVIPDDSPLGQAMRTLHGRASDYEKTFKTIVDDRLSELPDDIKDLMPEGLAPDKQVAWVEKALKVKAGEGGGADPEKKKKPITNGHKDPPAKGGQDGLPKVDDVIKEMAAMGVYRRR